MSQRLHAIVRGRVQMVGFRYFVAAQAELLGVTGWVRNGEDGSSVEVVAEGEAEPLLKLEQLLYEGPRSAVVKSVDADWSDKTEGHPGFTVLT